MYQGNTITGIIQARLESTRLTNRVLMSLADRPVIWHVIQRLKAVDHLDRIVVATSTSCRDDPLANYARQLDDPVVEVFRGPEDDVLRRFYLALEHWPTDLVVRATGHSPLLSPSHLQRMLTHLVSHRLDGVDTDYDQTGLTPGLGTEVYHHQAIIDAHLLAACPDEREDVGRFIRRHDRAFRVDQPPPEPELRSDFRLTLDYPEDYRLLARLYRQLYRPGRIVDCRRALEWLRSHPDAAALNAHHIEKTI